eukprot:GHRR01023319.1.p1 GENE.GHRR01023319.1~~GHRR01023319.1.p1  ORF type:complete len:499 (+),score=150.42 GHRR01023319.1:206-1702(+)
MKAMPLSGQQHVAVHSSRQPKGNLPSCHVPAARHHKEHICARVHAMMLSSGSSSDCLSRQRLQPQRLVLVPRPGSNQFDAAQRGDILVPSAMFDTLSSSLSNAFKSLSADAKLMPENMKGPLRDVRRALLEADVSLPVVRRFIKRVEERALGLEVLEGVTPQVQFVKVVNDELVELMGSAGSKELNAGQPQVILMAGLQGVGKTTACGKLALYLKKRRKSVLLVATDVYRPAAIDQLVKLGSKIDVPVFELGTEVKPVDIAKQGVAKAKEMGCDAVIIDTAGRLQIDANLMAELQSMKAEVQPNDTLLVVDAMTGQEAATLVKTFNDQVDITGAIVTKMDGDSRGGAALSVREVSGKPIKFVGVGEKMEALEPFYPERMAQRILGMGDMLTLYEKAQEAIKVCKPGFSEGRQWSSGSADIIRYTTRCRFQQHNKWQDNTHVQEMPVRQMQWLFPRGIGVLPRSYAVRIPWLWQPVMQAHSHTSAKSNMCAAQTIWLEL